MVGDRRIDVELSDEDVKGYAMETLEWFANKHLLPQDVKRILAYLYAGIDEAINWTFREGK